MANRPLLLFPSPELASKSSLPHGGGKFHKPSPTRQGERLFPVFTQLQMAFNARRVEVQQTMVGIDPEQVLVIETIGSIENFANAVKKIDGLEWMGEIEIEEILPDQDFYDEEKPEKELTGRLYLMMTNQQALTQMLSLWRQYQADTNMTFQRGLTKFRDVFLCLKDIRRWDVQDRLSETGILDAWREDLQYGDNRMISFEAELWFRDVEQKRLSSQECVSALIKQFGGRVQSQCVIQEIAYHSLLAELPANAIQEIINHSETELVKCDNIMFFRPVGQMSSGKESIEGDLSEVEAEDRSVPSGNPVVAILDGLPLANHYLLANRLIIDDPDDWGSVYPATERTHGTAITSLVVHGDLNGGSTPLPRPVYVRPIMKPDHRDWNTPRIEFVPHDVLVVDLIHRAVRRIFEGEHGENAVSPEVRIINLSIGDPSRQFVQSMSPLGRLLDWLSVQYNVLFVISAGNHSSRPINTNLQRNVFEGLSDNELEKIVVNALYEDARHRRLLAPAESINGITVGALHHDGSTVGHLYDRFDVYESLLPSPVSSFGSGYRRAIKPDLIYSGGKLLYRQSLKATENISLMSVPHRSSPGNKAAVPGNIAGELNKTAFCCGTSNSAALISRAAAICHDSLIEVFEDQSLEIDYQSSITSLLKAMIVHGCSWGEIGEQLEQVIRNSELGRLVETRIANLYLEERIRKKQVNSEIKKLITRWLGYGLPDVSKVLDCTEQRASLLGFGQLKDGEAHVFRLPLPPSLGARREWRKLTVTLAWLSPIIASTQKYRTASLWFEVGNELETSRSDAEWQTVRRGTVQHEVFEGEKAVPLADGDSLQIKVNCRKDAGEIKSSIAYGLVVSLEVAEGVDIAIYDEIRTRIAPTVQIRPGERWP